MSHLSERRVTVIGAGAWGSALAHALCLAGTEVCIWSRSGGVSLKQAMAFSKNIILAVPVQTVREVVRNIHPYCPEVVLISSKGLESTTGFLLSQVIHHQLSHCAVGAIGGPNLAKEVIQGRPCATTIAFSEEAILNTVASWFQGGPLHVEKSHDVIGVQVAGALKNVMAIGYGLLQQAEGGENLMATYLTKAMREVQQVIHVLGGYPETIFSYAGIGDLILTCCSPCSRNSQFGRLFPLKSSDLVEGAETVKAIFRHNLQVKIPLIKGIYEILWGEASPALWASVIIESL